MTKFRRWIFGLPQIEIAGSETSKWTTSSRFIEGQRKKVLAVLGVCCHAALA